MSAASSAASPAASSRPSIDDLLAELPIDQVAGQLGDDAEQARRAVGGALPALFGGLKANANDPADAASLAGALSQHDPGLVEAVPRRAGGSETCWAGCSGAVARRRAASTSGECSAAWAACWAAASADPGARSRARGRVTSVALTLVPGRR
ncbi:DUF937 domain-containing protein [Isoptericola variabilis]|uniref:DUF937 domain-containing protein n=1 Tax=Isoptericola variabilis TaxID=139208 RepID=UPI003D1C8BE8